MTRVQRLIAYSLVIFLMVWGLDAVSMLQTRQAPAWNDLFSPFHFSQLVYCAVTFLLTRWLWQKIILRRQYIWILPGLALLILSFVCTRYLLEEWLFPIFIQYKNYSTSVSFQFYLLDNIYYAIIYIALGTLLFLFDNQLRQQKNVEELRQKNKDAELQFLRTQIQPHFLFNTLNNIYSLVYDKSAAAPSAVLHLSELMRYLLYEKKATVELAEEWKYIQHFVALQRLRFDYELEVVEHLEGDWQTKRIPPYLIIPFLENAFKHGDFRKGKLHLSITGHSNLFGFEIRNPIGQLQKDANGGIGLDNVRRRLQLLFPERHELKTETSGGEFRVSMTLNL